MTMRRGDVFRHEVAGAGGWGDPLERDPAMVLRGRPQRIRQPRGGARGLRGGDRRAPGTSIRRRTRGVARPHPGGARLARAARRGRWEPPAIPERPRRWTRFRVGVDIGGTFTDIVFLGDRTASGSPRRFRRRVDDYARGDRRRARRADRASAGSIGAEIVELLHGTTVASNAILELKGRARRADHDTRASATCSRSARCGCRGSTTCPGPSRRRWSSAICGTEVDERVGRRRRGRAAARRGRCRARGRRPARAQGVEAIAVCLLHSYANPAHERLVKAVVNRMAPGLPVCISVRGAAGDQGIRADVDDGDQCLRHADRRNNTCARLSARADADRRARAAAADAVQWRADDGASAAASCR